jgi:hypothetical protein
MGIRHHTASRTDARQLAEGVDSTRRHLDEVIAQLSETRQQIAGPDRLPQLLTPATVDERLDLANACISLELALQDAQKWARKVAKLTRGQHGPDRAEPAAPRG